MNFSGDDWLGLLRHTADSVAAALARFDDWETGGDRPDQYRLDQVADAAALDVLDTAGVGILSEESGLRRGAGSETVIVDPVDGSTNASRRIPHYSISLCVVDASSGASAARDRGAVVPADSAAAYRRDDPDVVTPVTGTGDDLFLVGDHSRRDGPDVVPRAALVRHLVSGEEFTATTGKGAHADGRPIGPSGCRSGERAVLGVSGLPGPDLPVWQVRVLGSAALDLCAVACGRLDAYVDLNASLGVWDYAAGILVCAEAGAWTGETFGRELFHLDHSRRLGPRAASTPALAGLLDGIGAQRPRG